MPSAIAPVTTFPSITGRTSCNHSCLTISAPRTRTAGSRTVRYRASVRAPNETMDPGYVAIAIRAPDRADTSPPPAPSWVDMETPPSEPEYVWLWAVRRSSTAARPASLRLLRHGARRCMHRAHRLVRLIVRPKDLHGMRTRRQRSEHILVAVGAGRCELVAARHRHHAVHQDVQVDARRHPRHAPPTARLPRGHAPHGQLLDITGRLHNKGHRVLDRAVVGRRDELERRQGHRSGHTHGAGLDREAEVPLRGRVIVSRHHMPAHEVTAGA